MTRGLAVGLGLNLGSVGVEKFNLFVGIRDWEGLVVEEGGGGSLGCWNWSWVVGIEWLVVGRDLGFFVGCD